MKLKLLLLLLCATLISISAVAEASIFDSMKERYFTTGIEKCCVIDDFRTFFSREIKPLNTENNIAFISTEMEKRHVNIIKVRISDYNDEFYIARGSGAIYGLKLKSSHEITLSVKEIKEIKKIISDGKITFIEKIKLWSLI